MLSKPCAAAASTTSSIRPRPSRRLNSVWTWRWVKSLGARVTGGHGSPPTGALGRPRGMATERHGHAEADAEAESALREWTTDSDEWSRNESPGQDGVRALGRRVG